ncbi:sulfatase family protein [Pontiella sulfatireligans]|uniref:Arylsulfatase n=1 Tax=Pontiella sulfatireligans TaxID=2750658 RepID=A0A6C2UPA4_9BACT|nr:sulfatase-like hydrolase/transferase [Pontiella sulfatireligans]SPS74450.1 sulfatase S1_51 [Kiritimatiellales bacterium]VGO20846.1 Arylsulfatase [Pontiella sulfatireligans]
MNNKFIATGLIIGASLAVNVLAVEQPVRQAQHRPNIIFFLVDDYDKAETSVYGGNVLTPNLDRMAKNGLTFNNAHMTSTVCTPSRYTCMTGRYASSSYSNQLFAECPKGTQTLPAFNVGLEPDNMNVAKVLADNGYATGMVGKFHVSGHHSEGEEDSGIPKNTPYTDELNKKQYECEKQDREIVKSYGYTWAKNIYMENMKAPFKGHNPEWTISAAMEFVEECTRSTGSGQEAKPFFLYYGTTLLHGPNKSWYSSLMEKDRATGEGFLEKPIGIMDRKSVITRLEKAGIDPVENAGFLWMDDSLGMLLDKLEELGIADNTLVCFVADHGSKRKGSIYTINGTEVPCIISWPAGIEKGVVTEELIQNTDFVPTWFELAGVELPKGYKMDGVSMAPLFKDQMSPIRDYVFNEMGASRAVKTKEWSYMTLRFTTDQVEEMRKNERSIEKTLAGLSGGISRGRDNPNSLSYHQLYNLKKDRAETNNLVDNPEYAGTIEELRAKLKKELLKFEGRPYGEFVPGGNAQGPGTFDDILEKMKECMEAPSSKRERKGEKKKKERKGRREKK